MESLVLTLLEQSKTSAHKMPNSKDLQPKEQRLRICIKYF